MPKEKQIFFRLLRYPLHKKPLAAWWPLSPCPPPSFPPIPRQKLTAQEVRSALGEPDEIVAGKGVGEFDIWKYYLLEDCKAHLGMTAPITELFFFHGNLVNFTTHPYP